MTEKQRKDNKLQRQKTIENEIKKCICLCRNCHAEFHYIYGHKPEYPVEALQEYIEGVETMNIIVELSEQEIEMIKRGLNDHISDYCVSEDEEKPYQALLDKLNTLQKK